VSHASQVIGNRGYAPPLVSALQMMRRLEQHPIHDF
jgi:hypothetical protein